MVKEQLPAAADPPTVSKPSGDATVTLPSVKKSLPLLANLSEVVERPIFSPSRRPPKENQTASIPIKKPTDLVLAGVIVTRDRQIALVRRKSANQILRMSVGQQIDGWLILTILPDRMVIGAGKVRHEIVLTDQRVPTDAPRKKTTRPKKRKKPKLEIPNQLPADDDGTKSPPRRTQP